MLRSILSEFVEKLELSGLEFGNAVQTLQEEIKVDKLIEDFK